MNFQVRIRTDEGFPDIHYIQQWLDKAPQGFAFEHNKPGNHHYHIYLFGLQRNADAMRKHLGKHLSSKECYAVGITAGKHKEKVEPILAYQYGTTKILQNPIWVKGFSLADLQAYHENAVEYYKPVEATLIVKEEHYIVRPDRVWERLHTYANNYGSMTIRAIKSKLCAEWLNNGKAIPREADLNRYAKSLYMLNKYKKEQIGDTEIPDTAFMEDID